jgi:hypothetical protein
VIDVDHIFSLFRASISIYFQLFSNAIQQPRHLAEGHLYDEKKMIPNLGPAPEGTTWELHCHGVWNTVAQHDVLSFLELKECSQGASIFVFIRSWIYHDPALLYSILDSALFC